VYTYAIENLAAEERLTLPTLDPWPRVNRAFARLVASGVAWTATAALDGVVYGTRGAEDNYRVLFGRRRDALVTRTIVERKEPADLPRSRPRSEQVLFVGELAERKGLAVLLDAWGGSVARRSGWKLRLFGDGPLRSLALAAQREDPSISVERVERPELMRAYAEAAAVVQPSQRVRRWREQCGLGALEAEAFGCQIVLSSESGLAEDLKARAGAIVVPPGSVQDLRAALRPERLTPGPAERVRGEASYPRVARVFAHHFNEPDA
jgi:glycosyltransferase involved in cell wall biosynthesis